MLVITRGYNIVSKYSTMFFLDLTIKNLDLTIPSGDLTMPELTARKNAIKHCNLASNFAIDLFDL
jgi:hypothetical protein